MTTTNTPATLAARAAEYLDFLERWLPQRPVARLSEIIAGSGGPQHVAIVVVDLTNGFCHQGPLSSPRVAALLPRVARLLTAAHAVGVRAIVLPQDAHAPDAQEFGSFPPHCVRATAEALTAPELRQLPFAREFTVLPKNSISSTIATGFDEWDARGGPYATYIVVGDCTDFCIYQAATALKLRGNARQLGTRVIVPVDCVDTYDIPLETAQAVGAEPHPADLIHHVFLHSLTTNGVEIVASIQ
jgi:nicotinamidase-related amidase